MTLLTGARASCASEAGEWQSFAFLSRALQYQG